MFGSFGPELGRMRVAEWHAEAKRERPSHRPSRLRRALGGVLISAGARVGRVCVQAVPPAVERRRA
jgi:hypothetical protein